jgi:hypothetical protein
VHVSRPMAYRAIAAIATMSALAASTVVASASTTTTTTPAKGSATSSLTVLQLSLLGNTLSAGQIAAVADNSVSPHNVKLVVTPVDSSVTGAVGQQTITPGSAATTVPSSPATASLPNGVGSITGPTFSVSAADNATGVLTSAALKALGSVTILTMPVNLQTASLSNTASVTSTASTAEKSLSIGTIALPSLQDLLAKLGVNLNNLLDLLTQANLDKLAGLVTSTTTGAVKTANDAVTAARTAIGANAPTSLSGAQTALTTANGTVTTAQNTLTAANTAFTTALTGAIANPATSALLAGAGITSSTTAAQFLASPLAGNAALASVTSAANAVTAAQTALTAAQAAVTQLQALITALQALITSVLNAVNASNDPLASLGGVNVVTKAVAASTPTATADVTVASTHVLGTIAALPLSQLTSALSTVTSTLSSVLNSVTGVSFTPPSIAIGAPTKSTSSSGSTRHAAASISAVTVTMPTLTLPTALALPGVPTNVGGKLVVGQLAETATYVLGTKTTRTTGKTGKLANTGGSPILPIIAALLVMSGLAIVHRRRRLASDTV